MREVKTYYIQDGNTVRYTTAQPLPDRQTREREKQQEALRQRRIRERKRAAAMRRHRLHTLYLTLAVVAVCALFVGYVQLQTDNIYKNSAEDPGRSFDPAKSPRRPLS